MTDTVSYTDVKGLLDSCKQEMVDIFKCEVKKVTDVLETINRRVEKIEDSMNEIRTTIKKHDIEINSIKQDLQAVTSDLLKQFMKN